MRKRTFQLKPFYCYVDKFSGKKVITRDPLIQTNAIEYYYVAACPNERIAKTVYDRHLAIAQL